jgi:chromosome segregation ATPase
MPVVLTSSSGTRAAAAAPLALMRDHREQLTQLLRTLAARLDELDRRLTDLAWPRHRQHVGVQLGELLCERTALEADRSRLTERLAVLAKQLKALDSQLSDNAGHDLPGAARVGTCPYCGYPSLGSGLCAFCRPQLAH